MNNTRGSDKKILENTAILPVKTSSNWRMANFLILKCGGMIFVSCRGGIPTSTDLYSVALSVYLQPMTLFSACVAAAAEKITCNCLFCRL